MTQVVTKLTSSDAAAAYVTEALTRRANTYIIFSHVQPWANDSSPDAPIDNIRNQVGVWRGAVGGKKMTGNDLVTAVPRFDWTANTVYAAYKDYAPALYAANSNFYVMTDEYNIYKCLFNNNGLPSTVKPTYTSYDRTNTEADGYIWKYMLTLSTSDRNRFLTNYYIPIRTLALNDGSLQWLVQQNAVDGTIDCIELSNFGTGYTNASNVIITITGDGSSATAIANVNVTSQTVSSIIVTNPGTGYHYANVTISGGGGANAAANAIIAPFGGHGKDPISELGASNVIINIRMKGYEGNKLLTGNDFRQIAMLMNPVKFGTNGTVFANSVFNQTSTVLTSTGPTAYINDEYVFQGTSLSAATFSGRVAYWDNGNNTLYLTETDGVPSAAALFGANSGTSRFLISTTDKDLKPFSGQLMYIENITSLVRSSDQSEDIKIILQF